MSETMDMSDPKVQEMLEADKQEALARIRAANDILTHIWHANPDDGDVRCSRCDTAPWMRAAERRCGEDTPPR